MRALLQSVYDQSDGDSVHAQFDRILDALEGKLSAVAAHLDAARTGADGAPVLVYDNRVRNARAERPGWERKPEPKDPSRNNQVQRAGKMPCLPVDRDFSSGGREKYCR